MRLLLLAIIFFCSFITDLTGQAENSWTLFEAAAFRDVFLEEYGAYASMALHNTPITIKGYHIPVMEDGLVVLSKYPNANCFFCGGAGLESVLEVRLLNSPDKRFEMDEQLTFQGRLVINSTDYNILSFILEEAVLLKRE